MKSASVTQLIPLGFALVACLQTGAFGVVFAFLAVLELESPKPRSRLNNAEIGFNYYFYGAMVVVALLLAQFALQVAAWLHFPGMDSQVIRFLMHQLGFQVQGDVIYLLCCDGALMVLGSICLWCYMCSCCSQGTETNLGNTVLHLEISRYGQWFVLGLAAMAISTFNASAMSLSYLLLLITVIFLWSRGLDLDVYYAHVWSVLVRILEVHFFTEYLLLWAGDAIHLPEIVNCLLGVRKGSSLGTVSCTSIFYSVHLMVLCIGALCMKKGLMVLSAGQSAITRPLSPNENEEIYASLLAESDEEYPQHSCKGNFCLLKEFTPRIVYAIFLLVSMIRPSVPGGFIAISGIVLASDRITIGLKRVFAHLSVWILSIWLALICLFELLLSCSLISEYPVLFDILGLRICSSFFCLDLLLCLLGVAAFSRYQGESTKFNSGDAVLGKWGLWILQPCATVYIFYLGASKQDLLHLVILYSLMWSMWQAAAIFALKNNRSRSNSDMQGLLTVTTFLLYCCYLGGTTQLFSHFVFSKSLKQILQLIGAWNVSKNCLQACIGALLLEKSAYLDIGEVISEEQIFSPLPSDSPTCESSEGAPVLILPSFLHAMPLFAIGIASYLLSTLTASQVSLWGFIYLLLGMVLVFLHPRNLAIPMVQNVYSQPRLGNRLQALMRMPVDLRSAFNLQWIVDSHQCRNYSWLPLSLLGWAAFLDVFIQLGFSCISLLESVMGIDVSILSGIIEDIKYWTNSPDKEHGQEWLLYLLRPFLLICGIWLFKRQFSTSALAWQYNREIDVHRVDGERGIPAFIRRAVILHMPKVAMILAFAVSMQLSGIFGLCFTGCLVLMLPMLIRPNYASYLWSICFGIVSSLIATWSLTMYFLNIEAICDGVSFGPRASKILQILGLDFCLNSGQSLVLALGLNYALLLCLSINLESKSFVEVISPELRNWSESSLVPCPLFWPNDPTRVSSRPSHIALGNKYLLWLKEIIKAANIKTRVFFCSFLEFMELPRCSDLQVDGERPDTCSDENDGVSCISTGPCQHILLRCAIQDAVEFFYDDWGQEVAMLSVLFSAFYVSNAISLGCLGILGLGMFLSNSMILSKYFSTPFLALVLLWQYGIFIMDNGGRKESPDDIYSWLGLSGISADALWVVFWTYCLVTLDVSHAFSGSRNQRRRSINFFSALSYELKPRWRWQDWIRYFVLRWHLDFVLISVVVACILDNNVMHAGYLAMSFYFFRHRIRLRHERNRLFKWLPLYNFLVMTITILYQIPLESEKAGGQQDDDQQCNFAYLVGLHKLSSSMHVSALNLVYFLSPKWALTDIMLWLVLRLQTHLYNSVSYEELVRLLLREEELLREGKDAQEKQATRIEGAEALHASRQETKRYERIETIKMGLDRALLKFGAGMYPTSTDYNFLDSVSKPAANIQGPGLASSSGYHDPSCDMDKTCKDGKSHQEDYIKQTGSFTEQQDVLGRHHLRGLWSILSHKLTHNGPSIIYALFVATYIGDFSMLALMLPLSAFLYAIISVKPATGYWKLTLLYSEIVLILNYGFQIPARLHCSFVSGDILEIARFLGLHADPIKCLPYFFVYLVILFYICSPFARDDDFPGRHMLVDGYYGSEDGCVTNVESVGQRRPYSHAIMSKSKQLFVFLARACMRHESPPSFVAVTVCMQRNSINPCDVEKSIERLVHEAARSAGESQCPFLKFHFCSYIDEFGFPSGEFSVAPCRESLAHIKLLMEVQSLPDAKLRASLNPSLTAANLLSCVPHDGQNDQVSVVSIDHYSKQSEDWYALVASLDMITFLFIAFNYSKIVKAAGSVQEITSQHVVPLGYLITLIILFVLIVMDRLVYTMGSQAGKAALHVAEISLFFLYCSSLVWYSNHPSGSSLNYLRCVMVFKCISFGLCALQIRSGYPPAASYSNGMGRHTFIFMRSISVPASMAFHIFLAIPFVYEIRQILDWACTATTLTLYDWFKLEDINMSLYFATVMRVTNESKSFGKRQPRYVKFFQGGLSVFGILILLWVPLLAFSSGNPTTVVPSILGFSMNISMTARTMRLNPEDPEYVTSEVLFHGGNRALWVPWLSHNSSLPYPIQSSYSKQQFQLLCNGIHSDSIWQATPPLVQGNIEGLLNEKMDIAMTFGWGISRDMPGSSEHGGPLCSGTRGFQLSWKTRKDLSNLLMSFKDSTMGGAEFGYVQLYRRGFNETVTSEVNDSLALVPSLWLLQGDSCGIRPVASSDIDFPEALPGGRLHPDANWIDTWLSCSATIATGKLGGNLESAWWKFQCSLVNSSGKPWRKADFKTNACPDSFGGPMVITLLERVQGGLIGETINRFGVIGLYSVVVYGIGRFLRSSIINLRMRIPYENFPTTQRLISLCQDIYIARAEGLLDLEQELYEALLAVYRLPDLMYELTLKKNV